MDAPAIIPSVAPASDLSTDIAALKRRAAESVATNRAKTTRRAYAAAFARFARWADAAGVSSLPAEPQTIALYFEALAASGLKAASIEQARFAIAAAHKSRGLPDPTTHPAIKEQLGGLRRAHGSLARQAAPADTGAIRAMIATCEGDGLTGLRDRVLLLLGFAGAFRRSELVSLLAEDCREVEDGLEVLLRRSKTDPEGRGATVSIPYGSHPETCPVRAVRAWLRKSGIESGPLLRPMQKGGRLDRRPDALRGGRGPRRSAGLSPKSIALIIRKRAARAGLPSAPEMSGHSLRRGLAVSATRGGASIESIQRQGRWASPAMAIRYAKEVEGFKNNAAAACGL